MDQDIRWEQRFLNYRKALNKLSDAVLYIQNEFIELSKPYKRRAGQIETGTGLGLNICTAILTEHEFTITAEKINPGTKLKIKIK